MVGAKGANQINAVEHNRTLTLKMNFGRLTLERNIQSMHTLSLLFVLPPWLPCHSLSVAVGSKGKDLLFRQNPKIYTRYISLLLLPCVILAS